jgi:hypothetical protein
MLAAYLLLNAVLYAVFAVATTVVPARIATSLGFTLDTQGRIEFLTVYGGLELGLAAFYAWAVYAGPPAQRVALMFSLFVYAALVLYRGAGFALYGAPGTTLMGVAGLELLMLIGAVVLVLRSA